MDRAVLHAPRVGALLAVLDGEFACARVAVAERAFARVGAGTPVVVIPNADARDVLAHAAIVLQGAHHFAALASGATGAIGDDHLGCSVADVDTARCDRLTRDAPRRQHAAHNETGDAAACHCKHLATGHRMLRLCFHSFSLLDGVRRALFRGAAVDIGI